MQWIKSSERLPEMLTPVFVITPKGDKAIGMRLNPNVFYDGEKRTWMVNQNYYDAEVDEWLDETVSSIPSSGWVSAEERLPEKSGVYLAYETNHGLYGEYGLEVMRFDDYNKSWFFGSDCFHPIHWMPLPVPPQKD